MVRGARTPRTSGAGLHEQPCPPTTAAERPAPPGPPRQPSPALTGRPGPAAAPEHREAAAPCAGVPPLRFAPTEVTGGKGPGAAGCDRRYGRGVRGNDRRYGEAVRSAHRMSTKNVAQSTLLRLMRKEIRVTAGKPDRGAVHGSPPMDRTRLTPVGYGAAPSPTAAEHTKPPTAFTCSSGGHRMRTRRRTASSVKRNGARPFTSGRNPVVTSCDGPHTLRWGELRMQQVGE